jgi:hypothetical protein
MTGEDPINNGYCEKFVTDKIGYTRQCKLKAKHGDLCRIHHKIKLKQNKENTMMIKNNKVKVKKIKKKDSAKNTILARESKEIIDYNYLDRVFHHNLMNLYGSWKEIDQKEYIELSKEFWPIEIIINTLTHQINNSNMENPYSIFPNNPFTRKLFTPGDLIHLRDVIKELKISINISLKLLLEQPKRSIVYIYKEASGYLDRHSILLMSLLQQYLRFMTINYKNSQNNYLGFWVQKDMKFTPFEELYNDFKQVPYQIFNGGNILANPYREYLKYVLKDLEIDEIVPTDDMFLELIK